MFKLTTNYLALKIFHKKAKVDPKLCRFLAPLLARSCSPRVWRLLSQIKLRKRSRKGKKPLKKINIYLQFLTSFKFYLDLIKIEFSFQTLTKYAFVGEKLKSVLNTQAVGMDSGVHFSLSNFIEDILQPKCSKMSPTSNLGLYL